MAEFQETPGHLGIGPYCFRGGIVKGKDKALDLDIRSSRHHRHHEIEIGAQLNIEINAYRKRIKRSNACVRGENRSDQHNLNIK
jgi:hypothetical protein